MGKFFTNLVFVVLLRIIIVGGQQTAEERLSKVADEYWEWKLRTFPESATSYGDHRYDATLTQFTEEAFVARKEKCDSFLSELNGVNADDLPSRVDKETLEVIKEEINQYVTGFQWRNFSNLNTVNFLEGVQRPPGWISTMEFKTLNDYQKYLTRMKLYPTQLQQICDLMRQAIALGRTNHMVSVVAVPDQIEEQESKTGEDSAFYAPFKNETLAKSDVPMELWDALRNNATSIINNQINPAWGTLKTFLRNEYMNNTRSTYGVYGWENGLEFYKACLRFHLGSDKTPESIRDTGMNEIDQIKTRMVEIMRENSFQGTIPEFFNMLRTDPTERGKYYDKTADWLLDRYRHLVNNRINDQTMLRVFHSAAPVPCEVKARAYNGPSGSYGSNTFWVNTYNAKDRPTYLMTALTAHEASPGHHYQISSARLKPFPTFRRYFARQLSSSVPFAFPWYTAFTEGWGLYAEYLGEEMGIYNRSALELMGRYSSEIFRACRLVVDTGIHAFNMSRQEAIWLIGNNTAMPLTQIETEVDRYITWPGQACAYKIGEIEIKKWRENAKRRLGDYFNVKDFHKAVIDTGRAPLQIAEQAVENYIQETLATVTTPTLAAPSMSAATFTVLIVSTIAFFLY